MKHLPRWVLRLMMGQLLVKRLSHPLQLLLLALRPQMCSMPPLLLPLLLLLSLAALLQLAPLPLLLHPSAVLLQCWEGLGGGEQTGPQLLPVKGAPGL